MLNYTFLLLRELPYNSKYLLSAFNNLEYKISNKNLLTFDIISVPLATKITIIHTVDTSSQAALY